MTLVVIGHFLRERFSVEQPFLTYSANLNLKVKVLDFVKNGGPSKTELRTFRWDVSL